MNIVILDGYAANPGDLSWEPLNAYGKCTIYERTPKELIVERTKDAEIVLTNKVVFDKETITKLPNLKYIGVTATGYNIIDTQAAKKQGIIVTNIPAYSTESVGQMVFAHLLNITNRVGLHAHQVKNGKWSACADFCYWSSPQLELCGQKIGLIGLGNTGSATARIAHAFGLKVYAFTSKKKEQLPDYITPIGMDELFKTCDIISLHCPLTPSTKHLVNAERLSLMKQNAILINTGRGPLVDDQALANALNENRIYAAGIDVMTQEPPSADNPLLKARNCFITPHIAWATTAARKRLLDITISNIKGYIEGKRGKDINCINM